MPGVGGGGKVPLFTVVCFSVVDILSLEIRAQSFVCNSATLPYAIYYLRAVVKVTNQYANLLVI